MNFHIIRKDGKFQIYSGDYICYSKKGAGNEYFNLDVTAPACRGFEVETLIIKGKADQILKMAHNDIISLKYAGEIPGTNEEYFEARYEWEDKYFKSMGDDEKENFVRSTIELPIQFIDSVEESEALIQMALKLIKNYENSCMNKNF